MIYCPDTYNFAKFSFVTWFPWFSQFSNFLVCIKGNIKILLLLMQRLIFFGFEHVVMMLEFTTIST